MSARSNHRPARSVSHFLGGNCGHRPSFLERRLSSVGPHAVQSYRRLCCGAARFVITSPQHALDTSVRYAAWDARCQSCSLGGRCGYRVEWWVGMNSRFGSSPTQPNDGPTEGSASRPKGTLPRWVFHISWIPAVLSILVGCGTGGQLLHGDSPLASYRDPAQRVLGKAGGVLPRSFPTHVLVRSGPRTVRMVRNAARARRQNRDVDNRWVFAELRDRTLGRGCVLGWSRSFLGGCSSVLRPATNHAEETGPDELWARVAGRVESPWETDHRPWRKCR